MMKRYVLMVLIFIFAALLLYQPTAAKEDTAQITLRKTAVSKKNVYTYIVKKGDILSVIVRHIPGVTEEDISDNYRLIQELNPNIKDLNELKVGQSLILPRKPLTTSEEAATRTSAAIVAEIPSSSSTQSRPYSIKKGDTLIKIKY